MKEIKILKHGDKEIGYTLRRITNEVEAAIINGKTVILEIDIGEACPKCGGVSVDSGDMWFKQYGKRYRTCIDCMHIWPEMVP